MKIFWSLQSDTPGKIGRHLGRDALRNAVDRLKQSPDVEEPTRNELHVDQDIQGTPGSPDLVRTIFEKVEKSEVVVADVTIVGKTDDGKPLINPNVAIELGYALHACTDARVVLVFNKHYDEYKDLPFDLRHKGGAVVFDLAPDAERKEIEAESRSLTDQFERKLKPLLQLGSRIKEQLSLRAIIEHRLQQRHPLGNGGFDDVFVLQVSVESEGEQAATDFKLRVDIPLGFLDGAGGHRLHARFPTPGFDSFEITNDDEALGMKYLYPGTRTPPLITINYAVRDQVRTNPEDLAKTLIATVYSGSMKPKQTVMTIAKLME
jgi:hypothetical protein